MNRTIEIYTDGSCDNKQPKETRFGGWAFLFIWEEHCEKVSMSGGVKISTTSQRMELEAVLQVLTWVGRIKVNREVQVKIYSDSAYIVNCINQKWYVRWEDEDYLFIKNEDYWRKIIKLYKNFSILNRIEFVKVKGHSGNEFNEIVDKLAREERVKLKTLNT